MVSRAIWISRFNSLTAEISLRGLAVHILAIFALLGVVLPIGGVIGVGSVLHAALLFQALDALHLGQIRSPKLWDMNALEHIRQLRVFWTST